MAGARAVGTAGRGWRSSYAGSAGRHSCVRVRTRCSPPAVRDGPVARGVRGRALSPVRLPSSWGPLGPAAHVLWARVCGYEVQRCPRGPHSLCSSGAGSRGFAARVSVMRGVCGQAPPSPNCPPSGRAVGVRHPLLLWARVCGCGSPALSPRLACPVGAALRGGGGGRPGGVARHRCEGRLVSGAVPPPAARPLGRVAGVPRPVCSGCGRCGRGDPAPVSQLAPLRGGVARCGGGGRASLGGVPSTVVRGV